MNKKRLIEVKNINTTIKYVETHIDIIKSIKIPNEYKEKIEKSIEYLEKIPALLITNTMEYAEMKRKAYNAYARLKKELILLEKDHKQDEVLAKKHEVEKALEYYISIKELHANSLET